jgi:hypothetical protein
MYAFRLGFFGGSRTSSLPVFGSMNSPHGDVAGIAFHKAIEGGKTCDPRDTRQAHSKPSSMRMKMPVAIACHRQKVSQNKNSVE